MYIITHLCSVLRVKKDWSCTSTTGPKLMVSCNVNPLCFTYIVHLKCSEEEHADVVLLQWKLTLLTENMACTLQYYKNQWFVFLYPWFFSYRFVCKNNGVLFENDLIQIGVKSEFRQNLGRLGLFYGNKTSFALQVHNFKNSKEKVNVV
jgi:hypothetical protein